MRVFALVLVLMLLAPSALAQIELTPGESATCPTWFSGQFGPDVSTVLCEETTPTPEPTDTPAPLPTATPIPTLTSTAIPPTNTQVPPTNTQVPSTPTSAPSTAVVTLTPMTVNFNDITNPNRNLTGQYPTGLINWGTSGWWIGSAYGQFTTNSIGLQNAQTTTASFTFVTPRILVSLRANNVGTASTTLTISCTGNPTVMQVITVGQVITVTTGWTNTCTTVTLANTNAWNNDYDDLVIMSGSTPTAAPNATSGPSPSPIAQGPCTGSVVGAGGQPTIAAGMASAPVGGTVCIRAGAYPEQVEMTKRLTLQAYGDGPVWIDGGCSNDNAVKIAATAASSSVIRGLGMRNTVDAGVKIDVGVSGITIDANTIQNFDCTNAGPEYRAGVAVWLGGSGQRITSNTISRRTSGALTGGLSDGIWFKSNSASPSGGGHYIAGNVISAVWDGIGGETEGDSRGSFDRNTTIENNTITDCEDDGIQSDGGNLGNIIRGNTIRRCALGISNAPNLTGPVTIESNVILDGRLGSYGNLACFKVGAGGSAVANYTNNTCVISSPVAVGWSQTNPGNNPIVARGNQINVTNYVLEFSSSLPSGTSFDGDCLYTSDGSRFVKWGGTLYGSLAAFRGIGHEASGTSSSSCGS